MTSWVWPMNVSLLLAVLTACGGSGGRYDSAVDMHSALRDGGVACAGLETGTSAQEGLVDSGECDFAGTTLSLYIAEPGQDPRQLAQENVDLLRKFNRESFNVFGGNWVVSVGSREVVANQVKEAIGGEVIGG